MTNTARRAYASKLRRVIPVSMYLVVLRLTDL